MDGIEVIAILSVVAGAAVMLLGIAAKRSLEAKREASYNPSQGSNGFGSNSGSGTAGFRAAPNATDVREAVSAGKPLL